MKTASSGLTFTVLILLLLGFSLETLVYPVTVGGFTGDTTLQGFAIDASGNLACAAISSDTSLVSSPNTNLAMFFFAAGTNWQWTK